MDRFGPNPAEIIDIQIFDKNFKIKISHLRRRVRRFRHISHYTPLIDESLWKIIQKWPKNTSKSNLILLGLYVLF